MMSRVARGGRVTVPEGIRIALGLSAGDRLRYEIDGDRVLITKAADDRDEHGDDDLFTDEELEPIIAAALADTRPTLSAEEAFAEIKAHIEERSRRTDAA